MAMIGFDRPLRPEWIHQSLQLWTPNTPLRTFYKDFNKIAYQLYGKEGKRKARTVLFRYFLDSKGAPSNQVTTDASLLASLSQRLDLKEIKPLYLITLILRSDTLQTILKTLVRLYPSGTIEAKQLIEKAIGLYGERDVVKRSTRSFLTTLFHFGILNRNGLNYSWKKKLYCSPKQLAFVITFFCIETGNIELHLEQIKDDPLFALLDLTNLEDCARKYNSKLWSYIRRPSTSKISMYPNLEDLLIQL
ncbi:MAG: hypothetical protein IAX21_04030 [Candidatus Bathyarchaeota archaeon]|nr:MAG: hypothetical protein IAX21_04030 [Candidatus Bathyarchaeota archaeon]